MLNRCCRAKLVRKIEARLVTNRDDRGEEA
jgi:hypothetical protein